MSDVKVLDRCDTEPGPLDRPEVLLQFVVLGMLLADKSLRERVNAEDFSHGFAAAVSEIKNAKGRQAWPFLEAMLLKCGVEWKPKGKTPIERCLERLRLDSETSRAANLLINQFVNLDRRLVSDEQKSEFLRTVLGAPAALKIDKSVLTTKESKG